MKRESSKANRRMQVWSRIILIAACCAVSLCAISARAGDFRVEASVDRNVVNVGRTMMLTITVFGSTDVTRPDLGDLAGFEVLGTSSSQNISMINLKVTRSLSITYTLAAMKEGDYVLGPFAVRAGDNIGETEPISVKVVPASGGTSGQGRTHANDEAVDEEAAFATATVDKQRAYVGEQITYTLRFAYRLRMLQGMEFIPPEHTGFWYEDLGDTGPVIEVIDGRQYYVVTKKLAFFPISSGKHTVGESGIRYLAEARDAFSREPFSLFGRDPFGRLRGHEGVAMAEPLSIQVLPLPEVGRPGDFSGAVGTFEVTARATRREVKVGESITLVVKVKGSGNLKSVADLPEPEVPGFRVFAPKSTQTLSAERGVVGGEKRFEFVLVAQEPGIFTIDGIGFTYFDTSRNRYTTAKAKPMTVTVLPGDPEFAASGGRARGIDLGSTDIRHIRRPRRLTDDLSLVSGSQVAVLWAMPVIISIAGIIVKVRRRRQATCVKVSARRAYKDLMAELSRARAAAVKAGRRDEAAAILSRGITKYVAVRGGCKDSAVDVEYVGSLSEISGDTRTRLLGLMTTLDQVRFAPAGVGEGDMENLLSEAESILEEVNREWGA
jgi:hypothetical protein